jgi:transposase
MEDISPRTSLPDDVNELRRLLVAREDQLAQRDRVIAEHQNTITQHQNTITKHEATIVTLTQQRDAYHLEKLRLEVRLAKALKQAYGPRADRLRDPGQLLLDFAGLLDALAIDAADLPVEPDEAGSLQRRASRRLRTRGRRDIGALDHLPLIEQTYELPAELCRCPACQAAREKIGQAVSYTIEYLPGSFVRIKHVQHKYACRHCERNGDNPNITLAAKTNGSPIDKGLPGPGLLAYVVTAKFGDYLPLHRLQHIFGRQGFELDRSTMCLWLADVARLLRPIYDRMVQRALESHVLATDDTEMPLLQPGKAKKARMWIYRGDDAHPYNVFAFTESRKRDGPAAFLNDFRGTLLADAYGGYDGIVLEQQLPRAGCWAHARRKFVDNEKAAPQVARAILRLINRLFDLEKRLPAPGPNAAAEEHAAAAEERLRRRQADAAPLLDTLHALLVEQKAKLLPKHPLAEAIGYTLNQWRELTLFTTDPAVPIHNNLAEQQMKRIALLRKNALFAGSPRGGETAAILSSLTSTCRRHEINPQTYLTQLLVNLPDTPISRVDDWLPDRWKKTSATPPVTSFPAQP